ncbi:MAG: signal peptide peptidase SppA [Myxococcales bacterium]|nr:signal peptide peptidase SppA [Myxococcales bacterium]
MRIVFALFWNLVLLGLSPLRWLRRRFAAPRGAWLEVRIDGGLVEVARRVPFWQRRHQPVALQSLRRLVSVAAMDARVLGVLIRIESLRVGSARATSLRDVLLECRRAGKQVAVYLPHGGGTLAAYVASAADLVLLGPETHLELTGFAVEATYLKAALDRLGLEPEVFAKGRFKTAGEFLERKSMSEAQREQLGALLDVAHGALLDALATGREVEPDVARAWVEDGPWSAKGALEAGLIDGVVYPDELAKHLDSTRPNGAPILPAARYLRRRTPRFVPLRRPRHVAVIDVVGPIVSEAPLSLVPVAAEGPVCRTLELAQKDPRVSGVVVHVSSRGGSALASDRMLRALSMLAKDKPVAVYMGDVAASGGYMIAVGAPLIVAQPTTVTGSIGVVAARLVGEALLSKLGVAIEVVKRGEHADMMNPARRLSAGESRALARQLDDIYSSFLQAVARGRGRPVEQIEPLAGGRVWSGRDAHAHGLVDQLGGFDVALRDVLRRIGPGAEALEPVVIGPEHFRPPGPLARLVRGGSAALGLGAAVDLIAVALGEPRARAWLWSEVAGVGD